MARVNPRNGKFSKMRRVYNSECSLSGTRFKRADTRYCREIAWSSMVHVPIDCNQIW